jgi:hypothetical protein
VDIPTIGDELSASRAMRDLAVQLMRAADAELEAAGAGTTSGRAGPPYSWSDTAT